METRIERLEERVAELLRTVEELSDEVARQARLIERHNNRLMLLVEREAEREAQDGASEVVADQRPPHW